MMSDLYEIIKNRTAIAVLILTLAGSSIWVGYNIVLRHQSKNDDTVVIRLAHRVTDKNVQKAFRVIADKYEQINPGVKIEFLLIADKAYQQWITTQCIGKTVPDIVQMGGYYEQTWQSLATRYMIPLSGYVNRPNPYNVNTELENLSWRETYLDRMSSGYWDHLTEFYTIPLTVETIRVYYNKDMFAQAGFNDAPKDLDEFFAVCEKLKTYSGKKGRVFPIAANNMDIYTIFYRYYSVLADGMIDQYDACYWGSPRIECALYGLYSGAFTFNNEKIKQPFEVIKKIMSYAQPGFISSDSSQARFLFIQQDAAMIVGNVRDAKVFADSADFNIGIFDFPLPSANDPLNGGFAMAQMSESQVPTIHFSLTRNSPNQDKAVDFMMYCTSLKENELFNKLVNWYPVIKGAEPLPQIAVFKPHPVGAGARFMPIELNLPQVALWFRQEFPRYLTNEINFEQLADSLDEVWLTSGVEDYVNRDVIYKRMLSRSHFNVAVEQSKMLFDEAGEVKMGGLVGECSPYQLSVEVLNVMQHSIDARKYTWYHLQQGDYQFP